MLDMGFIRDIRKILDLLPKQRQNLLFSATFSDDVRALATGLLHEPARVQVTPRNSTTELIEQVVIPVDRERKRELLRDLITSGRIDQALVFTRTKHGANRLAEQLAKDGISAAAIHGNKSQGQRVRALGDFKAGRVAILVATDIAARGLDIEQLPHVVNYELPMVAEDYVHRIGRTGRAGKDGEAISLVCVDERPLVQDIQALLRRPIPTETIAGFEPNRNIRPEPIRLRSTPAERAEQRASRPGQAGAAGGQSSNRGGQPSARRPAVEPWRPAGAVAPSRRAAASPAAAARHTDAADPTTAAPRARARATRRVPVSARRPRRTAPAGTAASRATAASSGRSRASASIASTPRTDGGSPRRSVAGPRRLVARRPVHADELR